VSESAIRLHIEPLDEGGFVATSPDVPGLVAQGRTVVETAEIARDVARKIAESCLEHGDPLPPALAGKTANQPIDLTIPLGLAAWDASQDLSTGTS
jgi:predicted RNase H-like HicB family nuclease